MLTVATAARVSAQPADWRPLGPAGGAVLTLSPVPASAGTVWAGVEGAGLWKTGAGVWRSIDGGISWVRAPLAIPGPYVTVAADPVDPLTVYAGGAGGLLKSADGGTTWSVLHTGTNVVAFAVAPSAPQVLYEMDNPAGFSLFPRSVMSKSTDGGATWQPVALPTSRFETTQLVVDPTDSNRVYLTASGVSADDIVPLFYLTADGGATWQFALTVAGMGFVTGLIIDPRNPATLYAGSFSGGVFRSVDRGASWQPAGAGLPARPVRGVALDPASGALLAAVETGEPPQLQFQLWRSADAGATWQQVFEGAGSVYALAADGGLAGRVHAGGPGVGMLVSRDGGGHWQAANTGLRAVDIVDVAPDPQAAGTLYVADSSAGLQKSVDGGGTWTPIIIHDAVHGSFDVRQIVADPRTAGLLYASVGDTTLYKSGDGGQTWLRLGGSSLYAIGDVEIDPLRPDVLFAAGDTYRPEIGLAAQRSVDGGATWTPIAAALGTTADGGPASLDAVAFDPTTPGTAFIGGAAGLLSTADGGTTWARVGQNLPPGQAIARLRVDGNHVLYAVLAPGAHTLYRSTNGGVAWTPIDAGLPSGAAVRDLLVDPGSAALYAGTDAGVYRSPDSGAHWTAQNQGLGEARVNRLVMDPARPGVLYAGTPGGLYVSPAPAGLCIPSDTVLCLTGERFAAQMTWTFGAGSPAAARAVPLSDGAGGFWFFSPASTEVLLKIVDGGPVNGHFWVFSAGLSNVAYVLTLTDMLTGARHTYAHAAGALASFADTGTFAGGSHTAASTAGAAVEAARLVTARPRASAPVAPSGCISASDVLCVLGSRFQVQVTWQLGAGAGLSATGFAVPLSQESGAFWFFAPETMELVVKILDGRALGGHFWVFTAGLSSLAYTVTVTDTATGSQKSFTHPPGELASQFHLF